MTRKFVVAGTDTDVGKTVFAAALVAALEGLYWKPIQAGFADGGDGEIVRRLSGLPEKRILPEAYRLRMPASPHRAAEADGVEIDLARLTPPNPDRPLIIEAAGGLMVPLNRQALQIDLLGRWGLPVILCARTALGTINHSLLSIEALRNRNIPIHGVVFIGEENADSQRTICDFGGVRQLGRLPILTPLTRESLAQAFAGHFRVEDFA